MPIYILTSVRATFILLLITINIKKDLGGVLDDEVIDVWQQVLEDYKSGLVVAATMGIELVNESRHLHSSLILSLQYLSHSSCARHRQRKNAPPTTK